MAVSGFSLYNSCYFSQAVPNRFLFQEFSFEPNFGGKMHCYSLLKNLKLLSKLVLRTLSQAAPNRIKSTNRCLFQDFLFEPIFGGKLHCYSLLILLKSSAGKYNTYKHARQH